jgi:hypothetical protein
MTTTKTLLLAGLAALSLGAGAARAQQLTPSGARTGWYTAQNGAIANNTAANNSRGTVTGTVQSGASDPKQARPVFHFESNMAGGGF